MAVLLVVGSWFLSSNAHASLFVLKESSAAFDVVAAADPDAPSAIDVPGPDSQRLPRREGPHAVRNIEHPLGPARSLPVETSYVYDTLEGGTAATADDEPDEGADQAVLDADAEIDGQRHHYDRRTHVADTSADTDHHVARGPPSDKVLNAHDTTSNPVDPAGEPGWVRRAILGLGSESVTPSTVGALDDVSRAAFGAADDVGSFTVKAKHLPGAGGSWNKFAQGVDPHRAIQDALRSGNAQFLPNPNLPNTFRVVTDVGYTGGSRGETALRVIVSNDGRVVNACPGKTR